MSGIFSMDLAENGSTVTVTLSFTCPMCGHVEHLAGSALADPRARPEVSGAEITRRSQELQHAERAVHRHLTTHTVFEWEARVRELQSAVTAVHELHMAMKAKRP